MNEDQITKALRDLPRTRASDAFRPRLMERLEQVSRRPWLADWRLAAATAAVIVLALLLLARTLERRVVRPAGQQTEIARQERLDALRSEYRTLERDLIELRSLAAAARPLVGVEGDGDQDFLIDLRNLYLRPDSGVIRGQFARPVSFDSQQPRER